MYDLMYNSIVQTQNLQGYSSQRNKWLTSMMPVRLGSWAPMWPEFAHFCMNDVAGLHVDEGEWSLANTTIQRSSTQSTSCRSHTSFTFTYILFCLFYFASCLPCIHSIPVAVASDTSSGTLRFTKPPPFFTPSASLGN